MTGVAVLVFEPDGSSFYRLTEPARALREQGADVTIVMPGEEPPDADVIVVNRPVTPRWADFVELLVSQGRRVVVDMDDSYDHLASDHIAHGIVDPVHARRACKAATEVVVTTKALSTVYGEGRARVVPNFVPRRYLDVERATAHEGLWVGWAGGLGAHPNDLQATGGKVGKAVNEEGQHLAFVGARTQSKEVAARLGYRGTTMCTGFVEMAVYPEGIANFDIGLVPLADTYFNDCKSWLKGIEYASVGVPFIASPSEEYQRLFGQHGVGVTAAYPNDWYRYTKELLTSHEYRAEVAGRGRTAVEARLTLESNVDMFWDAWVGA